MTQQFQRIVADCPWKFLTRSDRNQTRAVTYGTMTLQDMAELPVKRIAAPDAALFFWTTNPFLELAFDIIKAWDFHYSSKVEWTKIKDGRLQLGNGYRVRGCTETLLICKRSDKTFCPAPSDRLPSWFEAPRDSVHSRKPERAWRYPEQYPGAGIELFSRRRRPGWVTIGHDIDKRDIREVLAEIIGGTYG
jgi:N6-adenosine-specific RNA methylase IME4